MTSKIKRFLSMALTVFMIMTMMPATVLATESNTKPNATVTQESPFTLTDYVCWPNGDNTIDRPLQAVLHFKANDTLEQAQASPYAKYKTDFYLYVKGLKDGSTIANDCYLAGKYGTFPWIVIPTDGLEIENGTAYPIVSNYDPNLTYENICDYVKEFTAAIYIAPAILNENPDFEIQLSLRMINPDNGDDLKVIDTFAYVANNGNLVKKPSAKKFTVTFDPNGGEGARTTQTFTEGETKALNENKFTRKNFYFTGWKDDEGNFYTNKQAVKFDKNTTLYAQWARVPSTTSYTVQYNANGGSGSVYLQAFTSSMTFNLRMNEFVREGYKFVGWNTKADGTGDSYAEGASFSGAIKKSIVLYAQWKLDVPEFPAVRPEYKIEVEGQEGKITRLNDTSIIYDKMYIRWSIGFETSNTTFAMIAMLDVTWVEGQEGIVGTFTIPVIETNSIISGVCYMVTTDDRANELTVGEAAENTYGILIV